MSESTWIGSPPATANGHRDDPIAPRAREVRRRRPLPSARAAVGGLLVALSALGLFLAWSTATAGPTTRFVVASRDLVVGSRIGPGDLTSAPMALPSAMGRRSAFAADDAAALIGALVISPVAEGELVQASALSDDGGAGDGAAALHVSIPVERSRAVGGALRPGAYVDVLGTFGAGADTYTSTVVHGARVVSLGGDGAGTLGHRIGDTGDGAVTLAVTTAGDARAVVHASTAGEVTLVRSGPPSADRAGTYRAPASGREE